MPRGSSGGTPVQPIANVMKMTHEAAGSRPQTYTRNRCRGKALPCAALLLVGALQCVAAIAAEIRVMVSSELVQTSRLLIPAFERETRYVVTAVSGPGSGTATEAIPYRLLRGEKADVLMMAKPALDELIAQGKVMQGSSVDFARTGLGLAVQSGSSRPNIGTVADIKRTLLNARSIAYADGPGGVYLTTVLFPRLGIVEQMKGKARMIRGEPVGAVVARGGAELGIQQISELQAILGIEVIGSLPDDTQNATTYSVGIPVNAPNLLSGKALIDYLSGPSAATAIIRSGMEPISVRR
jgi:molybdate transport system substrate-binding protein